ncbi:MAG: hypothetical protein WC119_02525 [Synergistaceae bacterium]
MNIFKVANEKVAPSWFAPEDETASAPIEEVERINVASEVDDIVLAQECDRIEECSTNGKIYHYNSNWDQDSVRHLREYAIACGMDLDKFKEFDPSNIQKQSSNEGMVKTAQTVLSDEVTSLRELWKDPFHIDERSDTSHMDESNWQEVKGQSILNEPSVASGNVIPLRGGENYFLNSDVNPASNQNSITNPDAIEQLANSKVEDNGERLKGQAAAKEAKKVQDRKDWEQEKISEMSKRDIIPQGVVFPTEVLNAQTGLNSPSSQMGVYAKFDPSSIPEKTAGEQIVEKNKEHRESIQRPKHEDDWQKPSHQSSRSISGTFADALAESISKIKK